VDEHLLMHDAASGVDYYYVPRELHSVAGLVDQNGAWVEVYAYDAYGAAQLYDALGTPLTASAIGNPYFFTGRRLEVLSNMSLPRAYRQLYHYRARAYDPRHGRFAQRDPAEYEDGMNLYEYVSSRPSTEADPRGLWIIARDGQATAVAEAEYEDTIEALADTIGLQADEWRKWITFDKILTQSSLIVGINSKQLTEKTQICPGQKVTIPNTVLAYWGGELGGFGKFWVMWDMDVSTLKKRGFIVFEAGETTAEMLEYAINLGQRERFLHGIFFWGHGFDGGAATDSGHKDDLRFWSYYEDWHPHYKMAIGIIFACRSSSARPHFADNAIFWGSRGVLVPHGFHLFAPTVDRLVPPGAQGSRQ
jgi:RHS repeat-associated protein